MILSKAKLLAILSARVGREAPSLAADILRAIDRLRGRVTDAQVAAALRSGGAEAVIDLILPDAAVREAFRPVREALRDDIARAMHAMNPNVPRTLVTARFDLMSPVILDAVQKQEVAYVTGQTTVMKTAIREQVAAGLRDGTPTAQVARELRETLGVTTYQKGVIRNFRQALLDKDPRVFSYALRDKRFDATLQKYLAGETTLSPERIESIVAAYERRTLARNATLQARELASHSTKIGNQAAWREAAGNDAQVLKTWRHSHASKEPREEHVALDGVEVPIDQPYPNGDQYPGENDNWGCKCVETYRVLPLRRARAA